MEIKEWINTGNLSYEPVNLEDLLSQAGRILDKAYVQELIGDVVFKGDDGKTYIGEVLFSVEEASQEYLDIILDDYSLD